MRPSANSVPALPAEGHGHGYQLRPPRSMTPRLVSPCAGVWCTPSRFKVTDDATLYCPPQAEPPSPLPGERHVGVRGQHPQAAPRGAEAISDPRLDASGPVVGGQAGDAGLPHPLHAAGGPAPTPAAG